MPPTKSCELEAKIQHGTTSWSRETTDSALNISTPLQRERKTEQKQKHSNSEESTHFWTPLSVWETLEGLVWGRLSAEVSWYTNHLKKRLLNLQFGKFYMKSFRTYKKGGSKTKVDFSLWGCCRVKGQAEWFMREHHGVWSQAHFALAGNGN